MATVTIYHGTIKTQRETAVGTPLAALLREVHAAPAMPCAGNRTCGKCRVRAQGALSAAEAVEYAMLGEAAIRDGVRLACFASIAGDCTIWSGQHQIATLSWARMPAVQADGAGCGVAVDIGTTTVVVRLYDCATGELLAETLEGNRQAAFGADVISRIARAGEGDASVIQQTIRTQLSEMTALCMERAGVDAVSCAVITGNTSMLHFYEGLCADGIAVAPFVAQSLFHADSQYPLLGAKTYLPPCISAYIGADITCAILASGMLEQPERTTLLVDIGTNGEIALLKNGRIYCCSTAAGPAFEGAGLHQGMRAAAGAITGLTLQEDGTVSVAVLGGGAAVGICGSGALDAVSVMLHLGILDGTGMIQPEYQGAGEIVDYAGQSAWRIPGCEVLITQKDIRQIQLAKSAICAGIRTLLQHTQVDTADVSSFYIAGGFGHSMNITSAEHIGLIPAALDEKVEVIGNGALAGATMLLLNTGMRQQVQQIAAMSEELALSSNETFMDLYIDGMLFEED